MASRSIHNQFVKRLLNNLSEKEIDEVNAIIDRPSKTLGPNHRVLYHSNDMMRLDSILVNKGNINREIIRQLHVFLDNNKQLSQSMELLELLKALKKR